MQNLTNEVLRFPLSFRFTAHFEDIFVVRGIPQRKRGTLYSPQWDDGTLLFRYSGADAIERRLAVHFSPAPTQRNGSAVDFQIMLAADESQKILLSLTVSETNETSNFSHKSHTTSPRETTRISTDDPLLNQVLDRSLRDLTMLRSTLGTDGLLCRGRAMVCHAFWTR